MKQLIEDRRKREEEFETDHIVREKESNKLLDDIRTQMDKLMKLVNDAHEATAGTDPVAVSSGPQVKLVPLTAQDDIESYLVTVERIMEAFTIPEKQWTCHLAQ